MESVLATAMSLSFGEKLMYFPPNSFLGSKGSNRRNCTTNLYGLFLSSPVACTFSCTMKFTVRDCDPNTGVPDEDGYDDEYVVSSVFLSLLLSTWPLHQQFSFRSEAHQGEHRVYLKHYFQNLIAHDCLDPYPKPHFCQKSVCF